MGWVIRRAQTGDLIRVLELWTAAEAHPSHTDDLESLTQLIDHDSSALLVADDDGRIVGSVIAGWDGWRGSIYRLAVDPSWRRSGLATQLLQAAEERLASVGACRLQAIVVESDLRATGFWRSTDWGQQAERLRFVRNG
jgi:ribosomal protein S18 acetylase RimI-like enzyme